MSRPRKTGLDYFPLDTGFFEDKRVRRLTGRFGGTGPLFYLYVLCRAYEAGFGVADCADFREDAAIDLGCTVEQVGEMRDCLLEQGMLDAGLHGRTGILSSHGIQKQYQTIKRSLKREVEVDGSRWLLDKLETESFIKVVVGGFSGENGGFSGGNDDFSVENPTKEKGKESEMESKREKGNETEACAALSCPGAGAREAPDEGPEWLRRAQATLRSLGWDDLL